MGKNKKPQQPQASSQTKNSRAKSLLSPSAKTKNQQKYIAPAPKDLQPNPRKFQVSTAQPYKVLNYTFGSKKVLRQFMLFTFLIVMVPIIIVYSTYSYIKDDPTYSELAKIVVSVGPSLLLINAFIGVYIYKVIKDPQNYTREQLLKHDIPVGFKEQSMNRKRYVNQPKKQIFQTYLAQSFPSQTKQKPSEQTQKSSHKPEEKQTNTKKQDNASQNEAMTNKSVKNNEKQKQKVKSKKTKNQ